MEKKQQRKVTVWIVRVSEPINKRDNELLQDN